MVIEAVTMYISLVKVFSQYISNQILKYSLAGWLLPLIFPIGGLAWGRSQFADPKTLVQILPLHVFSNKSNPVRIII